MKPTNELFAAICFLVLMEHHGTGTLHSHPNYISEKLCMMQMRPQDAYGMLDEDNQIRVRYHLERWGFELPDELKP